MRESYLKTLNQIREIKDQVREQLVWLQDLETQYKRICGRPLRTIEKKKYKGKPLNDEDSRYLQNIGVKMGWEFTDYHDSDEGYWKVLDWCCDDEEE